MHIYKLVLTVQTFSGFISWRVAALTGHPETEGIDIHIIIQLINVLLALLIMFFSYTFNYYYLKNKHSPIILLAEGAHSKKSLFSFRKFMFGGLICFLCICFGIILQVFLPENTLFPFNLYFCIPLTLLNWNILNYFWHKVHQKTAGWPEFRLRRTRRVQPRTTPEEIEINGVPSRAWKFRPMSFLGGEILS